MKFSIISLNTGKVSKLETGPCLVDSAFNKSSVSSSQLGYLGFDDDEQADLESHGGKDKAVCVYSMHHAHLFENVLGKSLPIPAFGENFSVDVAEESEIYVGDIFECGAVKLQVSQPRQPCLKAGAFHKNNAVIKLMTDNSATGFYFRVLSVGKVKQGDVFSRIESDSKFSLAFANNIMYRREKSPDLINEFINYKYLSAAWKSELGLRLARMSK